MQKAASALLEPFRFLISFLRLLRNFCVLCVRYFLFFSQLQVKAMTGEKTMANSIP
jgi:hypothetical protein